MNNRKELLDKLSWFSGYFKESSQYNALIVSELETATIIFSIIDQEGPINKDVGLQICNYVNKLDELPHHNGSGWWDYLLHLKALLTTDGFKCELIDRRLILSA